MPHEVAAERSAQLELIAGSEAVGEIRRDLAVFEPLHHQVHGRALRCRRDGVAALRRVSVWRSQTDVDVLSRQVTAPAVDLQRQPVDGTGLGGVRDDGRKPPRQSPAYRCSRHGSP
jgi:hypothetical protein